jgi:RNA polymerase sigma-70 factor (ECF subfamily)
VSADGDDRPDRELFRRLAGGDADALAGIYDRHGAALFRHAFALARNASDAKDLVQATFVRLATVGAPLLGARRPSNYVHRMLRSAWVDALRRRTVAREEPVEANVAGASGGDLAAAIDVRRALLALPEEQREAVVLHLFDGSSFREIGAMTNVSTSTAASRYRLGIERLRRIIGTR